MMRRKIRLRDDSPERSPTRNKVTLGKRKLKDNSLEKSPSKHSISRRKKKVKHNSLEHSASRNHMSLENKNLKGISLKESPSRNIITTVENELKDNSLGGSPSKNLRSSKLKDIPLAESKSKTSSSNSNFFLPLDVEIREEADIPDAFTKKKSKHNSLEHSASRNHMSLGNKKLKRIALKESSSRNTKTTAENKLGDTPSKNLRISTLKDGSVAKSRSETSSSNGDFFLPADVEIKEDAVMDVFTKFFMFNCNNTKRLFPHAYMPEFNQTQVPLTSCAEFKEYPSRIFHAPISVNISNSYWLDVDICHIRPRARYLYRRRLLYGRSICSKNLQNRKLRGLMKHDIYSTSLFDTTERLPLDPDPYFHCSYDYYYAGGNLCLLPNSQYILHVDGTNFDTLNISNCPSLKSCDRDIRLNYVWSSLFDQNSEIFEIQPVAMYWTDYKHCFGMRQRNQIILSAIEPNGGTKTLIQLKTKTTPFISFAQCNTDFNKFIVSTMKQHVRLYDLNRSQLILKNSFSLSETDEINWNVVRPWKRDTFVYANEKSLLPIDIRTDPKSWLTQASTFDPENNFKCEFISSMLKSSFNDLFYFGTNHKLYCLDMRYQKKRLSKSKGFVCCWTHQLQYPPLLIDSTKVDNNELIALSSSVAGDMVVCELTKKRNEETDLLLLPENDPEHSYSSYCLPYQPPTLKEAYDIARMHGKCFSPYVDLKTRIESCTTGLSFHKQEDQILLFTMNSKGDVFARRTKELDDKVVEERSKLFCDDAMVLYEKEVEKFEKSLNYTKIVNFQTIGKVFRCNAFDMKRNSLTDGNYLSDNEIDKSRTQRTRLGRWQKSIHALNNYKDALVKDILSVWDIEPDNEQKLAMDSFKHTSHTDKVAGWLLNDSNVLKSNETTKRPNNENMDMSQILDLKDDSILIDGCSQFFQNLAQSTQVYNDSMQLVDTTAIDNTNELQTSKKIKKKPKYIKGF